MSDHVMKVCAKPYADVENPTEITFEGDENSFHVDGF